MMLRTSRESSKRRVLVHGLPYFGRMFADVMSGNGWEFRFYPDSGIHNLLAMVRYLKSCDLAYQIGGRVTLGKFLRLAKFMDKQKIVVHWCGSDALVAQRDVAQGKAEAWITNKLHHWSDSEAVTRELQALGLACEIMPLPSASIPDHPSPLPAQFSVLVYVPGADRGELYGLDSILEVARELPQVPFELVGLKSGVVSNSPPNLSIHGHAADLSPFYRRTSVLWRPVRHDGVSFMVLEALGHGRHVLWSYPFPGCVHVASAAQARACRVALYERHQQGQLEINEAGVRVIAQGYLPQNIKKQILARLEGILQS